MNYSIDWDGPGEKERDLKMSLGEDRVRVTFNPDNNDAVAEIKQRAAELINIVDELKAEGNGELNRLVALAQTAFEDGAMWAVKAATMP